jgi:alpha-tubulin suppressor-like RCC1 family protein
VRCWGYGGGGRLGYESIDNIGDTETPESAGDVTVGGTVIQITAGASHTCAVLQGGAMRCWGYGLHGRLGYGDTANIGDTETPDSVGDVSVGGTVTDIAGGGEHTCARLDQSGVRCWGRSNFGQLGYGNTDTIGDNELPSSISEVPLY